MGKREFLIVSFLITGFVVILLFVVGMASFSVIDLEAGSNDGVSLIKDGRYDDAASVFVGALESNPDNPELLNYLGISHFNDGDYTGALKAFMAAKKVDPSFASAYHNLGLTYYAMGRYYLALENYERVINLGADDDLLHYHVGLTKIVLRDWDGAVESLSMALTLGSQRDIADDKMLGEYRKYLKYAKERAGVGVR